MIDSLYSLIQAFFVSVFCCGSAGFQVGDAAPDFTLPDQDGVMRSLRDYSGKYVVIYFYPKDDTPGCTKQACSLRDSFSDFRKNDIIVLGISYDSVKSHKEFAQKHQLPFVLLSDEHHEVAKKYGASLWILPISQRKTVIVDPLGKVCAILPGVDVKTHSSEVLARIEKDKQKSV